MSAPWHDYDYKVNMSHLVPGPKLSEVELLKMIGVSQWDSIADIVGQPPEQIVSKTGERLYASIIDFDLDFRPLSPDQFGEGAQLYLKNRINVYAKRFVEGLCVFGDEPLPASEVEKIESKADLAATGRPWAYMTNAFIAPVGGNVGLKIFPPAGLGELPFPELREAPTGITQHRQAQTTGMIEDFGDGPDIRLAPRVEGPIVYPIVPESDMNGAGLVLFARYAAIGDYGVRRFLTERLAPRLSYPLVAALSTERRHSFYFGNAPPTDSFEIELTASLLPPASDDAPQGPSRHRTPLKLLFRIDLYRASDKVLIWSSLVRKSLNVPGDAKGVLLEADRLLARAT